ncbi:hypothetical protein SNE40_023406 [Patella caerulea]|uniref:Uncharacterized protein n=1 Tax=Patella caerulea TaxID=87958 RepID=A0AAN8GHZ4_PATCE
MKKASNVGERITTTYYRKTTTTDQESKDVPCGLGEENCMTLLNTNRHILLFWQQERAIGYKLIRRHDDGNSRESPAGSFLHAVNDDFDAS